MFLSSPFCFEFRLLGGVRLRGPIITVLFRRLLGGSSLVEEAPSSIENMFLSGLTINISKSSLQLNLSSSL